MHSARADDGDRRACLTQPRNPSQNRWHTHRLSRAMAGVHNGSRPVLQWCSSVAGAEPAAHPNLCQIVPFCATRLTSAGTSPFTSVVLVWRGRHHSDPDWRDHDHTGDPAQFVCSIRGLFVKAPSSPLEEAKVVEGISQQRPHSRCGVPRTATPRARPRRSRTPPLRTRRSGTDYCPRLHAMLCPPGPTQGWA